jgi:hypothetical protein
MNALMPIASSRNGGRSPAGFSRIGRRMIEARSEPRFADEYSTLGEV